MPPRCVRTTMIKPTKQDGILAAVLIASALLLFGIVYLIRPAGDTPLVAVVTVDHAEYARLPLANDTTITLPTGHIVTVEGGEVSVQSAPCPDRICMQTPAAHAVGQCIVCLPEKVVITVTEDVGE